MKPIGDPAFWRQMDVHMKRAEELGRRVEELGRRKRELLADLQRETRSPEDTRRPIPPVEIRWNSLSVPTTSGPGGYTVTVAVPSPRKRRRWRWL